jgi:signal transduction histidine kinase
METILNTALDTVLAVLEMDAGCIYLLESDGETLTLRTQRGSVMPDLLVESEEKPCSCAGISRQAINQLEPAVQYMDDFSSECLSSFVAREGLQILISTPLVAKDRAVGALSVGSQQSEAIPSQELEMLTAIGQQIGMAVENARLYRDAERWAEELALLHASSIVLTGTLDPGIIYRQLTEQAAKLLGCQVASIFRWDEEEGEALEVFSYGLDESGLQMLQVRPEESPLLQELIAHRRSVAIEDGRSDPRILPVWRERYDVQALLCLPLWGKEKPLGFLFLVDRQAPRRWQVNEVTWAESFVNNAAIALENAYLYEQAERAATLEERQRIAAEMHDGLAQTLSYLTLKAGHATELLEEGRVPEVLEEYADIQSAVERATREVRRSIASLQESPQPRRPLQDSLADMLDGFAKEDVPPMKLVTSLRDPLFVPSYQSEQVLRVVQEALWNAVRHSGAQQITVCLDRRGEEVTIAVEDNGCGFDPSEPRVRDGEHFGLSIMRARAARIGGILNIDSAPGLGARVSLAWNLDDPRTRAEQYRPGRDTKPLIPIVGMRQS